MAELMAKKQPSIKSFKKGEVVTGIITKLTSSEILIEIGAKTEAVVLEKDKNLLRSLLSTLKVGERVNVSVLNPESDQGNPVVSLRRFMDEKHWGVLDKLQKEEQILEVTVTDVTKGGFLVTTADGMNGFLPNSQAILSDTPSSFVGKKIKAQILEINRPLHKVIFSQKAALGDEDFIKTISQLKIGEIVDAVISNTTSFGIFVSVKSGLGQSESSLEGFIHLSELSWDKIETAENYFKIGEKIKAQVLGIDKEAKRINLSIKRMTIDPFEETAKEFVADKKVKGKITQISSLGITLDLGEGVEGLIKKDKIPPSTTYASGDELEGIVSEVDVRRHRVILTPVLKEKPIGYR
ncbi:MAG: 30S ribosomal protein S1 [Candidatus Levybacteria bacterium]|nr:30S ribosomal protein S1 [Candidatus Levybacteria bacterium]